MSSFNIETVRRVVGLTLRRIRYWDKTHLISPSVQPAKGRGSRRLYSFEDLVELRVIAQLMKAGLSLQKVRRVAAHLHDCHADVRRPLANLKLITDGETVFVVSANPRTWEDTLRGGQIMLVVPLDEVWNETQSEVLRIADVRKGQIRVEGIAYAVTFEPDLEDGGWIVECPALPGCVSQGDTIAEARKMIREAISGWREVAAPGATGVQRGHAQ